MNESFHLAEVRVPLDPGQPWGPVWDGIRECSVEYALSEYGYDDLADDSTAADLARYAMQDERFKVWLVALRGDRPAGSPDGRFGYRVVASEPGPEVAVTSDVLAVGFVGAPRLDNTHLLETNPPQTRDAVRDQGIEDAFFEAYEAVARVLDRDTVLCWANHRGVDVPESDPRPVVTDPTGSVRLLADSPAAARYVRHGWSLAQAERHSVQPIPVPEPALTAGCDTTRAEAGGYEVLQWTGLTPQEHLDDLALLNAAMATDPPLGDVDWRPEVWDAERVQNGEVRGTLDGDLVTTAVRHIASGRLVGFTQISTSHLKPAVAFQWATLVLKEHRGHGLGMLLKAANARLLHEAHPAVRRVHTWNADENDWMLRVNVALGYVREGFDGCWQKVLAPAS